MLFQKTMDSDEDLINILDNVSKSCTSAVRKKEKAEMSHGDNQLFSYDQSKKSNKSNSLLEDLLDEFTEPLNGDVKTTSSSGYSIPRYYSSWYDFNKWIKYTAVSSFNSSKVPRQKMI